MAKRNENCKKLPVLVFAFMFWGLFYPSIVFSQYHHPNKGCNIFTSAEPEQTFDQKGAHTSETGVCVSNGASFAGLDQAATMDNSYLQVTLDSNQSKACIYLSGFGFEIPDAAYLIGLQLVLEGHVLGGEGSVRANRVILVNEAGFAVGKNMNKAVLLGEGWKASPDSTDNVWVYGHQEDQWGVSLSEGLLNHQNFGVLIELENVGQLTTEIFIDAIQFKVHYIPQYSLCNHDCITWFVNPRDDDKNYIWKMPPGFEVLSGTTVNHTINISAVGQQLGTHQICVDIHKKNGYVETCCRIFKLFDCTPGSIGDFVWHDLNANGVQDGGEPGIAGVGVLLMDEAGQVADSTTSVKEGFYEFAEVYPTSYFLKLKLPDTLRPSLKSEGLPDSLDSDFTLAKGQATSSLFQISPGESRTDLDFGVFQSGSIGDFVWFDSNMNGLQDQDEPGIENVYLELYKVNGQLLDSDVTDSLGNYLFDGLNPGEYVLKLEIPETYAMTVQGNTTGIDSDFSDAGISPAIFVESGDIHLQIDAGLTIVPGSISGNLWYDLNANGILETAEPPISLGIQLFKTDGALIAETNSTFTGYYLFDDLAPGAYYLVFQPLTGFEFTEPLIGNQQNNSDVTHIFGEGSTDVIQIEPGDERTGINAGYILLGSSVEGRVWLDIDANGILDNGESGIGNITVSIYNQSGTFLQSTISGSGTMQNPTGTYLFKNLNPGMYYVEFEVPEEYLNSPSGQGSDPLLDSDVTGNFGPGTTDLVQLKFAENLKGMNSGLYIPGGLGGSVWFDNNADGIRDEGEEAAEGIEVLLFLNDNSLITSSMTNSMGRYDFGELGQRVYFLQFVLPDEYQFTLANQGSDDSKDSDVLPTGITPLISLAHGVQLMDVDAGLVPAQSLVGSRVWHDLNGDGLRNAGEPGIPEIRVELYMENGALHSLTHTDQLGQYLFNNLDPGSYLVRFEIPETFIITNRDQGGNDNKDSDINDDGWSDPVYLDGANYFRYLDAGMFKTGKVFAQIWNDENADGIFNDALSEMGSVAVELVSETGQVMQTANIEHEYYNGAMQIELDSVVPGWYYLKFHPGNDKMIPTLPHAGSDHLMDSDTRIVGESYQTELFLLTSGGHLTDFGAGFYESGILGNLVWLDIDQDGVQDEGEPGLVDIDVQLFNMNHKMIRETRTDIHGQYEISQIPIGNYYLKFVVSSEQSFSDNFERISDSFNSDVTHEFGWGTSNSFVVYPSFSNFDTDAGVLGSALAIEDLKFEGVWKGNHNALSFSSSATNGEETFVLQKSLDAHRFVDLQSFVARHYELYRYDDFDIAKGNYYYRIKEIYQNGDAKHSPVHHIFVGSLDEMKIGLYPNPASDAVRIGINRREGAITRVEIFNPAGEFFESQEIEINEESGDYSVGELDLTGFNTGLYYIRITTLNNQYVKRLYIQK